MPPSTESTAGIEPREGPAPPQYDEISTSYTTVKQLPTEQIETFNLHNAVRPYLTKDSRVLDIACGTGHYTRKLVSEWGAASAVGVDISPKMVEAAQKEGVGGGHDYAGNIEYIVGDARSLGRLDDSGFDLVIGSWLLNYANTEDELVEMFRTISANLNSNTGVFVGTVPFAVAAADLDGYAKRQNEVVVPKTGLPPWRYEIRYQYPLSSAATSSSHCCDQTVISTGGQDNCELGWKLEVRVLDERGEDAVVAFEANHMPKEVFVRAAKKGGMTGELSWVVVRSPVADTGNEEVKGNGDGLWDEYFSSGPHFAVLVVHKGEGGFRNTKQIRRYE